MSETVTMVADTSSRPKSKKELRAEKKAAKKKAATTCVNQISKQQPTEDEIKAEKHRLKKELRKERLKEREKEMIKEMRREKKLRQQKRKRRELHAVGGGLNPQQAAERLEERRNKKKQKRERNTTQDATASKEMAVFDRVFNGAGEEDEKGTRVLEMGVKATDVVIGKGQIVQNNSLVTVRYKLTGGKFGALIDSNNKFVFRVGKLEVIQGWDIGVLGMAVGGTRKLVVPPKAGYGSKDIGAGSGGLLHFDITVLSCT